MVFIVFQLAADTIFSSDDHHSSFDFVVTRISCKGVETSCHWYVKAQEDILGARFGEGRAQRLKF